MAAPPVTILHSDRCIDCEFAVSARSSDALAALVREHVQFVNATKDFATDPHFGTFRLSRLVES